MSQSVFRPRYSQKQARLGNVRQLLAIAVKLISTVLFVCSDDGNSSDLPSLKNSSPDLNNAVILYRKASRINSSHRSHSPPGSHKSNTSRIFGDGDIHVLFDHA